MNNKDLCFECYYELVCEVDAEIEKLKSDKYKTPFVSIVADDYYEAREIVKELIIFGYDLSGISLHFPEFEDYHGEYIIGVSDEDFFCSPAMENGKYIGDICDTLFISNGANSSILKNITCSKTVAFDIGFENNEYKELDFGCDNCEYNCEYNNKTSNKKESFDDKKFLVKVDGKEVSKEEADKIVKDALLSYCETMDKINEAKKEMQKFEENFIDFLFL